HTDELEQQNDRD
ncbi:hypothetical protein D030_3595B, partial [Vibrio parahaemolyticus AQ3810]